MFKCVKWGFCYMLYSLFGAKKGGADILNSINRFRLENFVITSKKERKNIEDRGWSYYETDIPILFFHRSIHKLRLEFYVNMRLPLPNNGA